LQAGQRQHELDILQGHPSPIHVGHHLHQALGCVSGSCKKSRAEIASSETAVTPAQRSARRRPVCTCTNAYNLAINCPHRSQRQPIDLGGHLQIGSCSVMRGTQAPAAGHSVHRARRQQCPAAQEQAADAIGLHKSVAMVIRPDTCLV
jgi:hypothetical protein